MYCNDVPECLRTPSALVPRAATDTAEAVCDRAVGIPGAKPRVAPCARVRPSTPPAGRARTPRASPSRGGDPTRGPARPMARAPRPLLGRGGVGGARVGSRRDAHGPDERPRSLARKSTRTASRSKGVPWSSFDAGVVCASSWSRSGSMLAQSRRVTKDEGASAARAAITLRKYSRSACSCASPSASRRRMPWRSASAYFWAACSATRADHDATRIPPSPSSTRAVGSIPTVASASHGRSFRSASSISSPSSSSSSSSAPSDAARRIAFTSRWCLTHASTSTMRSGTRSRSSPADATHSWGDALNVGQDTSGPPRVPLPTPPRGSRDASGSSRPRSSRPR
mmetsp:Transcript_8206/g.51009  ORF Transcript_8206/g.51009 Transcript_8206/m.51009 type:complete len:340 (+) Transcript_8206:734-1753(+)